MSHSCYDVIIVGAGLSGLRVGIEVLSKSPHLRCCIIEKYGYNGGRVFTYRKKIKGVGDVQWEHGAGRISTSHKKVLSLLKKYKLTFLPISGETMWLEDGLTKNDFSDLIDIYITPLLSLEPSILQSHTLSELLHKVHGDSSFYLQFPYYAEIHTIRADLALESFQAEMKSNSGFGICQEGLSSLTDHMADEFIKRGGTMIHKTELQSISYSKSFSLECFESCTKKKRFFTSPVCVLALHQQALMQIKGVQHFPVLKKLIMEPLLRVYAVFPVTRKQSWFSDLSKIVTPGPIRYIIPIDPSRGIIMISYTDGKDATYWMKQSNAQSNIMTSIRKLFPDRSIPDPIFFKLAPWTAGCTYWLPGTYDVQEESHKSLQPDKKIPLFMCGESFAVHQVWMESALDQADCLLQCDSFQSSLRSV